MCEKTLVQITQYLKNSRNRIEFTWTNFDDPKVFHLAVFLCDTRSPDVLAVRFYVGWYNMHPV